MIRHLYVHVPFCHSICFYCDFFHRVYNEDLSEKWLEALGRQIERECEGSYETVYIGGGTPSCLTDDQLHRLLRLLEPYCREVKEYTIEINPESFTRDKGLLMKKYGINRASIGIQTSDDDLLRNIGRKHSFSDCRKTIETLRDIGISNISADLMYSLPSQTMEGLRKSIKDVLDLKVPHISIYSLQVEENTIFGKRGVTPLDSDTEADMYEMIVGMLSREGYHQYEVSNFALSGYESRHNIGYWDYDDFLGISMGAASKVNNRRYTVTRNFDDYFRQEHLQTEVEEMSEEDLRFEHLMMSLRKAEGLDLKKFNEIHSCDFLNLYNDAIEKHKTVLEIKNDFIKCTNLEILNTVLVDFLK